MKTTEPIKLNLMTDALRRDNPRDTSEERQKPKPFIPHFRVERKSKEDGRAERLTIQEPFLDPTLTVPIRSNSMTDLLKSLNTPTTPQASSAFFFIGHHLSYELCRWHLFYGTEN